MTRLHRVHAFCDWLQSLPSGSDLYEQPGFRFFADMTDGEIMAAINELYRRIDAIQIAHRLPSNDDQPEPPR